MRAGHQWRVLAQLAARRGVALVCVQPLLVYRAREGEDLTFDKSDPKDAVIIARLAAGLHCYEPERADAVWARLRHLGARPEQLTAEAAAAVNQIRDLLECAWPAALEAAGKPWRSWPRPVTRTRFPRSLVKHAGLCPRDNASGGYQGKTSISGRGRPGLRVAAWRAVWTAMPNNPVMAARFTYLTTRDQNRLARQQARTALPCSCRV